jgi:class 3 adenylate cyclase/alpha-beta hydrolase superfamily lysophospholipase
VSDVPEVRYARTADGAHIAYQVVGDGPVDLLYAPGSAAHIDLVWEVRPFARLLRRLASFSRLILFDQRGVGLSDPLAKWEEPSMEDRAREMLEVLDAAGSERAAVVANDVGGLMAVFFAASYPHRTSALVLHGCYARLAWADDYPWGVPSDVLDQAVARIGPDSAPEEISALKYVAPHALQDPEFVRQYSRRIRSAASPARARALAEAAVYGDVRALLPAVQGPSLVLYRRGDRFLGKPYARYLAEHIPDAKLVEVPGDDTLMCVGDFDPDVEEIEEFLTGARHVPEADRVLATVLFTDIVGSTERAAELGDRAWRDLLDRNDQVVRRQIERFRGREVNTIGDGFVATFDGPGRAIHCACAIRDAVYALGLEVRVGLHTGEIEMRGSDIAGMAVHIGARVASCASPGEVLVSGAIPPLVAGSGLTFEDRGDRELKGVPGTWRLFAVTSE